MKMLKMMLFVMMIALLSGCQLFPDSDIINDNTYQLTINANVEDVSYSLSEDGPYDQGDTVTITIDDYDDAYVFMHFTDHADVVLGTDASLTLTMDSDQTIYLVFEPVVHVEINSNIESLTYHLSDEGPFKAGDSLTITFDEVGGDYVFVHYEDAEGQVLSTDVQLTLTLEQDIEITLVFASDDSQTVMFSLSSELDSAIFTGDEPGEYEANTRVTFGVYDESGAYLFSHWETLSGEMFSGSEDTSIVLAADTHLVAVFDAIEAGDFALNLESALSEAHLNTVPSKSLYLSGEQVVVEAPHVEGFTFVHWYDHDLNMPVSFDANYGFAINRTRQLEAVYLHEDQVGVFVYAHNDTGVDFIDHEVLPGTIIELEAPNVEGYQFAYWYDETTDSVLSSDESISFEASQTTYLIAFYAETASPEQILFETFTGVSKGSYADGTVLLNDEPWSLNDALIGSLANDQTNDSHSVRIRNGSLESEVAYHNVASFSFYYGAYLTDDESELEVFVSLDGHDWLLLESLLATHSFQRYDVSAQMLEAVLGTTYQDGIFIRLAADQNQARINVDHLSIYENKTTMLAHPFDVLDDTVSFPNNSERLTLHLDDLNRFYSYDDTVNYDQCYATDIETGETIDCHVYGEVDTTALGEYDITYYAIDEQGYYASQTITKVVFKDASYLYEDYDEMFDGYYEGIEGLYGEALQLALRDIINDGLILQSYGDARYILEEADRDPNNPNNVLLIYDRRSVSGPWNHPTWEREHVWPSSRLGMSRPNNSSRDIGTDLHNLRAITPSVNQSRGNLMFGYEDQANAWYPGEDRGDVARIYFYMVTAWEDLVLGDAIPDGETYTKEGAIHGYLSALIDFHYDDPVDDFERQRQTVIYDYQNNRNPFIDLPHLVSLIWFDHENIPVS